LPTVNVVRKIISLVKTEASGEANEGGRLEKASPLERARVKRMSFEGRQLPAVLRLTVEITSTSNQARAARRLASTA